MTTRGTVPAWTVAALAVLGAVVVGGELRARRRVMRFDLNEVLATPPEQLRFVSQHDYVRMVGRREARRQQARARAIAAAADARSRGRCGVAGQRKP
jgi:hypothetical protein